MASGDMMKEKGLTWLERLGVIGIVLIVIPFFVGGVIEGVGNQVEAIQTIEKELSEKQYELEQLKQQVESVQRSINGAEDIQMLAPSEELK